MKTDKKIIIAIDGFSSTGKSTIAKQLAKALGYAYVDTGAMYRAVTLYAMQHNIVGENFLEENELIESLKKINLKFKYNEKLKFSEIYLNNENVEKDIRTMEVSRLVSKISAISDVRKKLVEQQREMGKERGLVMDGRDIGTVVFPDAELKLFMTASAEKRANRRYKELLEKGNNVTFEEVLHNVQQRDNIDSTRADSPLVKAEDAIEIDNSDMGLKEQYERLLSIAKRCIKSAKTD
ncbi:(d)CMP kinase [Aureibaculum sp. 2210JD6-5]|uniref:(d)CMP kinase n=1 Tax=Aureibaculum sp. 2210JD6-5 TaxID=3103957 RepID=UPI002AAE44A1|nr:(d)CMP kinase [Aureibaculum sp. 2210JD6-5]MDY7396163.1 (d)CMP kinase [Aureibaculum sp. 2210JD6-5]